MDDHGFEVIDCHQHLETGVGLKAALSFGGGDSDKDSDDDREFSTRISVMDNYHMRGAVIIAGNVYFRPNGLADTMVVNNKIAAYCKRAPGRMLGGVGLVEPVYGPAGFAEVKRCKEELGLTGIAFHNAQQGVPLDSPLMFKLIEKIGDAGLVPFIHALGNQLESVWQVDLLADAFPDLTMIVLDGFHDISQVKCIPSIAERHPNLYFDLVLSTSFEFLGLPQIKAVGADRFLFGTNFYSWPTMKKPLGRPLEEILESDLPDVDKAKVLGGNIARILGLNGI